MNDVPEQNTGGSVSDLNKILSAQGQISFLRRWRVPVAIGLVVIPGVVYLLFTGNGDTNGPQFITEAATRGELVVKVTATGNLEPTNKVDVGSELSGTIIHVFVDDDDQVTSGQVLAELDLSSFEDAVARSRATVKVAEAGLKQAQATVQELRSKLARYGEVARLSDNKVPSRTEIETVEAELARAEAETVSAQASITEAKASLRTDETKLGKARIRSPIDGVVLERAVDPGQAVAATLQAVTLFTLAEDLSKMKLEVDVDEADIGQIKVGLNASFTVDAWPDRQYEAVITRVGFNASDNDGVISYPAVLHVVNDDLSLRPGMTATAEITTITRNNALLVPNAALRFSPMATMPADPPSRGLIGSLMPRPPSGAPKSQAPVTDKDGRKRVWVLRNGEPVPVQVITGASNGRFTEIVDGDLQEGENVITEAAGT